MKVRFVRWHRNSNYFFVRWRFFNYLFLSVACSLEAVSVVVLVVEKLFNQSDKVQGCRVLIKLQITVRVLPKAGNFSTTVDLKN